MKKLLFIVIAIFLLSGCSDPSDKIASANQNTERALPKIPKAKSAQVSIPESTDSRKNAETTNDDEADMEGLIERINKDIELTNITIEDIDRGWYYSSKEERKWGTPQSWIWVDEGAKSYWISPNAMEKLKDIETDELCRQTAGYYVISCIEREIPHCEHIEKSECRCSGDSAWVAEQGCIMFSDDSAFINISPEELQQGWYYGLSNEKKFNTPSSWVWMDNGQKSRWQNPSPKR